MYTFDTGYFGNHKFRTICLLSKNTYNITPYELQNIKNILLVNTRRIFLKYFDISSGNGFTLWGVTVNVF